MLENNCNIDPLKDMENPHNTHHSNVQNGNPLDVPKPLSKKFRWFSSRTARLRILALLAVIVIITTIVVFWEPISQLDKETLEPYGYLGAFLVNFIASASIFLPVPGILVIAGLGELYNPFLVGLAGGAGAALGEITGYLAGYSGQSLVENRTFYPRFEKWMKRRGPLVIFIFSAIPNPLFDIVGAGAGILKYPLKKFLLICFIGKVINSTLIALFGDWGISWFLDLFR